MDKLEIEKNILDLSYKRNLQLLNIILVSGLGALFAYIGALILNPEKIISYTFVMIIVASLTYVFYRNVYENLRKVSEKLKNLI